MKRRAVVLVACSVLLMYVVIYSYSYNPDRYFDDIMSKFGADYRHFPPGLSGSVLRCGSYRRLRVQDRRLAARDQAGSVERSRHPQQCSVQLGVGRDSERSSSRQRWPPHHWVVRTVSNSQLSGCNSVDIGAQIGDTTLNLAAVFPGGTVTAFEMGPPIDILRVNVRSDRRLEDGLFNCSLSLCRLNPQFNIDVHNVAVSNKAGRVFYQSGECC